MKKTFVHLAECIHFAIFQQTMSLNTQKFVLNTLWSIIGIGSISIIMLFVNIIAGRVIGPEGYGKFNLILSIAQLLVIPIIFGFDSVSIQAIASSKEISNKINKISSSFCFILMTIGIFVLCYLLLYFVFFKQLQHDTKLFLFFLFFLTILLALKTILNAFIIGLGFFKFQFIIRLIEIVVVISFFIIFFFITHNVNYIYYVVSLMSGIFVLNIFYVIRIKSFFKMSDFKTIKKLFSYGKIITLSALSGMLFSSVDKFIIAKYLGITELGIYSAYYTAASFVAINFSQLFLNVFFPSIAEIHDKLQIKKKIDKIFRFTFVPGICLLSIVVFIALKFFGVKYNINSFYIISFSTLGVLQIFFAIYHFLIMSISMIFFKKYLVYVNIFSIFYAGVCFIVIFLNLLSIQSMVNIVIMYAVGMILIQQILLNNIQFHLNSCSISK